MSFSDSTQSCKNIRASKYQRINHNITITSRDFFWVYWSTDRCHIYLIPRPHLESLKAKTTSDHRLVSVPGVRVSRWNQVFETGRLWAGHRGGRTLVYSLWHTNLRGSRNHCWNRVRPLVVWVSALLWWGKVYFGHPPMFSDDFWEGGGREKWLTSTRTLILGS